MISRTGVRRLRIRAREGLTLQRRYTVDNPVTSSNWPPPLKPGEPIAISYEFCKTLMRSLELEEKKKLKAKSPFEMPGINEGDLVEVKYELSRTKQSFSIFQGYCIEVRRKRLTGGFVLKNTFDGIGVEQFFPFLSPRLIQVSVIKPLQNAKPRTADLLKPRTRNYRYQWHTLIRQRHSEGKRVHWRMIRQNPGIMSLEPKIRTDLAILRRRYNNMRIEAGLPPYLWPGPYHIHTRQTKEVTAEQHRRMLIYAWDERRKRATKLAERNRRQKWGVFKLERTSESKKLPIYHPLSPGNLPK